MSKHKHHYMPLGRPYFDWVDGMPCEPFRAELQKFFCTKCAHIKVIILEQA